MDMKKKLIYRDQEFFFEEQRKDEGRSYQMSRYIFYREVVNWFGFTTYKRVYTEGWNFTSCVKSSFEDRVRIALDGLNGNPVLVEVDESVKCLYK